MELVKKIERAIRRERMLAPGSKVAAACSGGADSVALVRLLAELKDRLGMRLLIVHLNHQLRGEEADADEAFVRRLAERLELEFLVGREDVAARAQRQRINVEEAGREARLEFFASVIAGGKAEVVALAHTLDDQAETVLARIVRGAGTRGLAGIYPVVEQRVQSTSSGPIGRGVQAGLLVRPLLGVRRAELRDYLSEREQPWREDSSNLDRTRLRNRLRLELLPRLVEIAGPAVGRHFGRLANHARQEESFWAAYVEERFRALVRRSEDEWELGVASLLAPAAELARLPARQAAEAQRAVARRLVRRVLAAVRGDLRRVTQTHVEQVLRLAEEGHSGQSLHLPGARVERRFDALFFCAAEKSEAPAADYVQEVSGPGRLRLPDGGGLEFKVIEVPKMEAVYNTSALDAGRAPFPLLVRSWKPGDRYCPRGRQRREKLKVLFQQGRMSRRERARCLVVLCGGEIVWTPAFGPAADRQVGPESRLALVIEKWAGKRTT